jgi:hypothetical protein
VVAALALLATGCTVNASGMPTAETDSTSSSTPSPTSESSSGPEPTVDVPSRPRDITIDGLDPCTLYTQAQRAQLKANDVQSGESDSENFKGMKECVLSVDAQEPFYEYNALAVTTEGVEEWLTGNRNVDAELISVQGFPAARFKFRGVEDEGCDIAVGVAEGQYLWFQVIPISRGFKQDQLCQMVSQSTEMAMTTLQTLK